MKNEFYCFKCGNLITDELIDGRVPFRSICPKCKADIHSCENCVNYQPGLPNDCKIPLTEYVRDRSAANFCEDFKLNQEKKKNLFKDEAKERFNKLFGD